MNIFSWHGGDNALVVAEPTPDGKNVNFIGFKGKDLRAMGWKVNDDDMRKILPRFGQPSVIASAGAADVRSVAAMANGAKKIDARLRGR